MKTTVNPYVTYDGNCEEAFNFYKSVFGGEFEYLGRFRDMPSENPIPEEKADKIMHVSLRISEETVLMGSDSSPEYGQTCEIGNNVALSLNASSEEEAYKLYNELSKDGKINMPIQKTFWGALYGMFTDKFGINWMVNYSFEQEQ